MARGTYVVALKKDIVYSTRIVKHMAMIYVARTGNENNGDTPNFFHIKPDSIYIGYLGYSPLLTVKSSGEMD